MQLFSSYVEDQYTEADLKEILNSFDAGSTEEQLQFRIAEELERKCNRDEEIQDLVNRVEQRLFLSIRKEAVPVKKMYRLNSLTRWISGAAAAIILIGFFWWNWFSYKDQRFVKDNKYGYSNDILPIGNKATLILSDGRSVELDKDKKALRESDGTVIAANNGLLVYKGEDGEENGKALMNTLVVPKGSSYELFLPDGSKVWVNASSILRFPTQFSGKERRVFIEGEAYFQIAKNRNMPFRVEAGKATVEALGTQFNVNSDKQNGLKATLTEGSVLVSAIGKAVKLTPGQEAVLSATGRELLVRNADVERATAWKDGYFYFKYDHFDRIMNEIADWYGLELHYQGEIPKALYTGSVDRKAKLSEVLEMLKSISPAKFEIDRQHLTIKFN